MKATALVRVLSVVALGLVSVAARAAVLRVPQDYPTIQSAIDVADKAWEIVVAPGVSKENIQLRGRDVVPRSTDPTSQSVVAATVIDADNACRAVWLSGTETAACVLAGFTIRQGSGWERAGIIGNFTTATIFHNIIEENRALKEDDYQIRIPIPEKKEIARPVV